MQLGRSRLSPEERERRFRENLCLYCGQSGHRVLFCPLKGTNREGAAEPKSLISTHLPLTPAVLSIGPSHIPVQVFIDSGADANFMDQRLATDLKVSLVPLHQPLLVHSLNDQLLHRITTKSQDCTLSIDNHSECLSFYIIQSSHHPLVLGTPWLIKHNPQLDWTLGWILQWGTPCLASCLRSALPPREKEVEDETQYPHISKVPEIYLDLKEVFNKTRATSLPPHRPYDCSINLLPGSTPPRGRLFSLSPPEQEAMQKYISEALDAGLIRPSSSPAGPGSFSWVRRTAA